MAFLGVSVCFVLRCIPSARNAAWTQQVLSTEHLLNDYRICLTDDGGSERWYNVPSPSTGDH